MIIMIADGGISFRFGLKLYSYNCFYCETIDWKANILVTDERLLYGVQ